MIPVSLASRNAGLASDHTGPVPDASGPVLIDPADQLGNIEAAPEYGIDITIHGGTITYGPWADRQR
jgi:hypothetical protein